MNLVPRIRTALEEAAARLQTEAQNLIRAARVPVRGLDPLDLVSRAEGSACEVWYWRSPDGPEFVALGTVHVLTRSGPDRFSALTQAWQVGLSRQAPLVLCGFSFAPDGPRSEAWDPYPAGILLLPRLILARFGPRVELILAVRASEDPEAVARVVEAWLRKTPSVPALPKRVWWDLVPEPDRWKALVRQAAEAMRGGDLRKVVLARAVRVWGSAFDPVRTLRLLRERASGCTVFGVRARGRWFLGASPERLVRVRNGRVEAMALAGSAPRGFGAEDGVLGARLMESRKDREEHRIVVEFVRDRIGPFCSTLTVRGPELFRTASVQHLCTHLQGILIEPVPALQLAGILHPTPAVAGFPLAEALRWIGREDVDRGWYAGAIGWMNGQGEGEFVVGIRSALVVEQEAWVYAGCGIVAESDPDAEYAESELKMQVLLEALGVLSGSQVLGGACR